MKIRAVIFDVYGTLLKMSEPSVNCEACWRRLFDEIFHARPSLSWVEFLFACQESISVRHAAARARGIAWPEILWPSVVAESIPEIASLSPEQQEEFIFRQMQIEHTVQIEPGAAKTLGWLHEQECLLGIASNGQSYTLREMREELKAHGLDLSLFEPDLSFWSFAHGFSKPDPYVFQILTMRLEQRGVAPKEILMVGDSVKTDLAPAELFGWQTWHLTSSHDWPQLAEHLQQVTMKR